MYVHVSVYNTCSSHVNVLVHVYLSQDPVDSSEKLSRYASDVLHGNGYKFWFDKSLSAIFYKNAVVSIIHCILHIITAYDYLIGWTKCRTLMVSDV